MNVLFVASEGVPFIKTGGLADVIGSLPKELKKQRIEVRVFLPNYKQIPQDYKEKMVLKKTLQVPLGWRNQYCGILEYIYQDVTYYFIDNQYYFYRDRIYGYNGSFDEAERFVFFSRAVLEALPYIDFQPQIIHLHEWQTALTSVFLKAYYQHHDFYKNIRTVFTIHNLKYQGIFPRSILGDLFDLQEEFFTMDGIEFYGQVNFLKGGLAFSDKITTVSRTYAKEIQYPYFGEALDGILRKRNNDLYGILNGIDEEVYNPATDPHLFVQYDDHSIELKTKNKIRLQEELSLPIRPDIPMIAIVSRLVAQKGLDLIVHVLDELLSEDIQLVILGTGERHYEEIFLDAMIRYPHKLSVHTFFDEGLARQIYAASDLFLMPSLFEPCGLSQLIALRYHSIPIVRETGGLKDTVQSYNEFTKEGNGFSFTNYNAHDMLYTVRRAIHLYYDKENWTYIHNNIAKLDNSWKASAKQYIDLYHHLLQG
ncbi:glycogen synthase GlgA [Tepidibacillus fermentans]|uniref:Glycogen synthase n=1 Tax=Tepidibacillus fermentans TaxID=1281767 RepID=A0A4R3KD65_9BACI|nr:glycogen synthase GlgA [Tepidibacillus fermentans]TCS81078.1 starch synthase [Tepidibacillus fermentans]